MENGSFVMDLPIKNGDVPVLCGSLPGGITIYVVDLPSSK